MTYESIQFTIDGGIATLTLNRPERLNSFTQAMHLEVRDALKRVQEDKSVRVLLLTGAGRGFCAGQDLNDRAVEPGAPGVDLGESVEKFYAPLVLTLKSLPLPVICAVNGVAAGAGANLALACDIVLAAQSASFIEAFCKLGLIPDTGGTWGLIWRCVPDESLMDEALTLARHFATAPTKGLAFTKRAMQESWGNTLEQQLRLEAGMMRELGYSHDYREGVAAFIAKRQPAFKGE